MSEPREKHSDAASTSERASLRAARDPCDKCGHPSVCRKAGECVLIEPVVRRTANVPARTLQPGDKTPEGLTVLRVTPLSGRLCVRFENDDTLWRVHRDSLVRIVVA